MAYHRHDTAIPERACGARIMKSGHAMSRVKQLVAYQALFICRAFVWRVNLPRHACHGTAMPLDPYPHCCADPRCRWKISRTSQLRLAEASVLGQRITWTVRCQGTQDLVRASRAWKTLTTSRNGQSFLFPSDSRFVASTNLPGLVGAAHTPGLRSSGNRGDGPAYVQGTAAPLLLGLVVLSWAPSLWRRISKKPKLIRWRGLMKTKMPPIPSPHNRAAPPQGAPAGAGGGGVLPWGNTSLRGAS